MSLVKELLLRLMPACLTRIATRHEKRLKVPFSAALFSLACTLFLPNTSMADAPFVLDRCSGEPQMQVTQDQIQHCSYLAGSPDLGRRQKAEVYYFMARAEDVRAVTNGVGTDISRSMSAQFIAKSLAQDPSYVDPYFYLAWRLRDVDQNAALEIISRGLANNPQSAKLKSELAYVARNQFSKQYIAKLCHEAQLIEPIGVLVNTLCGETYKNWNNYSEAIKALSAATRLYDFKTRYVAGFDQISNPWYSLAEAYHRNNEALKAAETLLGYKQSVPAHVFNKFDHVTLGGYYGDAGEFEKAAMEFDLASRKPNVPNSPYPLARLKMTQLWFLAKAGNETAARNLAGNIIDSLDVKSILQLQVHLKNDVDHNLPITGKLDDETQAAVLRCIRNEGCSSKFALTKI